MKQTAVEFILSEIWKFDDENLTIPNRLVEMIEQAKEIEKQQIIEAGNSCALKQHLHSNKIDKMTESELIKFYDEDFLTFGEQYYNETFKK